jgi:microcystin-dependent protein
MAQVTLPYTLTAGTPENVNNLNSNLNALTTGVNTIDTAQLTASATKPVTYATLGLDTLDVLTPIGSLVDYAGAGDPTPGSGSIKWLLADGRAVSRTTYAALYAVTSTTYGVGDGVTTFNLPDFRGRVSVGPDTMGTAQGAASRMASNNTRGAVGGAETFTLGVSNIPQFTPAGTIAPVAGHSHTVNSHTHDYLVTGDGYGGYPFAMTINNPSTITANWQQGKTLYASGTATPGTDTQGGHTPVFTGTPFGQASPTAINNTQPYQVANKIIRVA